MLAGIVLRAWVLPEGEGVLWNLSLGQGPQLMRGLSAGGGRGSATLFYCPTQGGVKPPPLEDVRHVF